MKEGRKERERGEGGRKRGMKEGHKKKEKSERGMFSPESSCLLVEDVCEQADVEE